MSPEILNYFSSFIEKESGIAYLDSNLFQLKTRLEDFIRQENIPSVEELRRLLDSSPSFLLRQKIIDMATNNETLFFRDSSFFKAFKKYLFDFILPTNPKEIKIWSAASSFGQEALSIAMTLEELSYSTYMPPYKILATDISHKAIKKAKTGIYTDFELGRGLNQERKDRFFQKVKGGFQVRSDLFSKIDFRFNNLTKSSVTDCYDFILCRNVLIYQRVEIKKMVLESMSHLLNPQGVIMLGVGETMYGVSNLFEHHLIDNYAIFRPKKHTFLKVS